MMAPFEITVKGEIGVRGRREIEDTVGLLVLKLKPVLDDLCGEDGWVVEWRVDMKAAIEKFNQEWAAQS
jgi:hypothetical protein